MAFPRFGQGAGTPVKGNRGIFAAAAGLRASAGNTIRALASRGPTPGGGATAARFVPASPGKARAGGGKG